jgi:hypothetical protein
LGRHYVLGTNYRSTQALVGAVNHWFAQAEQRPGEGAFMFRRGRHNPLPFEPVAAQGRSEQLRTREGAMPALTVAWSAGCDEDTGAPLPLSADEVRRRFAARCAEQIVQWLADPQAGFAQPDGRFVRLRPADIAVLVRTGREAAAVRRELQARAVASVYLSDQDSVFASDEAHDLLYGCAPSPRRWMPRPCARAWRRGSSGCRWTNWPGWPPTRKPSMRAANSCASCTASGCAWACWPCCARPCTAWTCPPAGCRTPPWAASGD